MTPLGIVLVLAAACCHATWNVFVKRIDGGPELIWLFSLLSVLIYLPVAVWIVVVQQPVFGGQQVGWQAGEAFQQTAAAFVEVDSLIENHVDG